MKEQIAQSKYEIVAATFNNEYVNLEYIIKKDGEIKLIDVTSKAGMRIYRSTLIYILGMAFERIFPNNKITVNYQLTNSMFCDIDNTEVTEDMLTILSVEMRKIIKKDMPIKQIVMTREEAAKIVR